MTTYSLERHNCNSFSRMDGMRIPVRARIEPRCSFPNAVREDRLFTNDSLWGTFHSSVATNYLGLIQVQLMANEDIMVIAMPPELNYAWMAVNLINNDFVKPQQYVTTPTVPKGLKEEIEQLVRNFHNVQDRIVLCARIENKLSKLEDILEHFDAKALQMCVCMIRDVLNYNYAEDINKEQFEILKKGFSLILKESCSADEYDYLFEELLSSNLSLLPNSQKVISELEG